MRHRRKGRTLGRCPSHQRALLKNLASALFLSMDDDDLADNRPKVRGRIVTTLAKAKEVRPLVERSITIARKGLAAEEAALEHATDAAPGSQAWKSWRESQQWQRWTKARAGGVNARRRVLALIGDKRAVRLLFSQVAPQFVDRPGGYTRVLKLSKPRLGDAGPRAILEFVGVRDRVSAKAAPAPKFEGAAAE